MHESAPNGAHITDGYAAGYPQCGHTDALLVPAQVYRIRAVHNAHTYSVSDTSAKTPNPV